LNPRGREEVLVIPIISVVGKSEVGKTASELALIKCLDREMTLEEIVGC